MIISKLGEPFDESMLPGLEFAREVSSIIQDGLGCYATLKHEYVSVDIEAKPWKQDRHTPLVEMNVFANCLGVKLAIGRYVVESKDKPTVDDVVTGILNQLERRVGEFVKSVTDSINFWHQEVISRRTLPVESTKV